MSISCDNNIAAKQFDKLKKYKKFLIKIEKTWHLAAVTIPVNTRVLGMIRKGTEKYLRMVPGSIFLQEVQKIVFTRTAHILKRIISL